MNRRTSRALITSLPSSDMSTPATACCNKGTAGPSPCLLAVDGGYVGGGVCTSQGIETTTSDTTPHLTTPCLAGPDPHYPTH
jgi:hypothetical protein